MARAGNQAYPDVQRISPTAPEYVDTYASFSQRDLSPDIETC